MVIHLRFLLGGFLVLFCCGPSLLGQSTEAGIKARLRNKPLYLRGFWRDTDLKFDADGKLVGQSLATSFTLSGFDFRYAHIKKDKLEIEGNRVGVEFVNDTPKRVSLGQKIRVDITLPANGDFTHALDAIFADGLIELAPTLPSYWQHWAKSKLLPPETADSTQTKATNAVSPTKDSAPDEAPKKIGGSVQAPRLNAHREAEFNETARQLKYSGKTVVGLIVNTDGMPEGLSVIRPAGVGMDEEALAAVQSYRFSPAMENGKAVRVEVNVVVSFDIF